jgi:hypothetical protein
LGQLVPLLPQNAHYDYRVSLPDKLGIIPNAPIPILTITAHIAITEGRETVIVIALIILHRSANECSDNNLSPYRWAITVMMVSHWRRINPSWLDETVMVIVGMMPVISLDRQG